MQIFMQIFMSFYEGKLGQQICYSSTRPCFFNQFKMVVQFFETVRPHQVFPILMVSMIFSQIQQAPCPNFKKVGKSLTENQQNEKKMDLSKIKRA